jgi:hypothetical protein
MDVPRRGDIIVRRRPMISGDQCHLGVVDSVVPSGQEWSWIVYWRLDELGKRTDATVDEDFMDETLAEFDDLGRKRQTGVGWCYAGEEGIPESIKNLKRFVLEGGCDGS